MKYMTTAFLTLLLGLTTGCGSSSDKEKEPAGPDESAGLLVIVENPGVLEASLKSAFTTINSSNLAQAGPGVPAPAPADSSSFTGTYTQEVNVDEFDAVRYDGSHLFVAPRKYLQCCFLATPTAGASSSDERPERSIRILSTDPASGTATLAGTIPLEDGISVQGMYLAGESMFALTGESLYGTFGGGWADFAIWAPEQLGYRVYDVADKANPVMQVDATIDGIFVDSRRIGDTVYIISRYSPYIDELIYYVTTEEERLQNEQTLASVSLDDMLPKITVNGVKRNLVTPENCFVTDNDEAAGYPVLTSITAISVDDPTSFSTTCYNEEAYGVYVSDSALYLTEILTTNDFSDQTTRIHKFSLSNTQVNYRGSADIDGVAWSGGQADFRISEHNGDLRVLSTSYDSSDEDFVDHHLYVLRESASEPSLEVVATLPNDQRPEEIGKPNEALYGVRFMGDRAYAVTFMQIDPLYVIDLADPTDPYLAGELEVTGFSDFLHPVNENLLLGLGSAAAGGIKLELFDVSDLTQPLSRGSEILGGPGSYTEAQYDRHAFTYQADVNGVDRLAIPANLSSLDGSFGFLESGLYLFEIHDKATPSAASIIRSGSIIPPADGDTVPFYSQRNRSFIHNETVFFVRDETVWAAGWQSPTMVGGPF